MNIFNFYNIRLMLYRKTNNH